MTRAGKAWLLALSAGTLALHWAWVSVSSKWTSPVPFFVLFHAGLLCLLLLARPLARQRLPVQLAAGLLFAVLASASAWLITDALIAPQRLELLASLGIRAVGRVIVEAMIISAITGGLIVGLVQAYVVGRFRKAKELAD